MDSGIVLLPFDRLVTILDRNEAISSEQALVSATLLVKKFGCVPTSLAADPEGWGDRTEPEPFTAVQVSYLRAAFSRYDFSLPGEVGAGRCDSKELQEVYAFLGMPEVDDKRAFEMIAEVDRDDDGVLDFEEFLDTLQAEALQEHIRKGRPMKELSFRAFAVHHFKDIPDGTELVVPGHSSAGGAVASAGGVVVSNPSDLAAIDMLRMQVKRLGSVPVA